MSVTEITSRNSTWVQKRVKPESAEAAFRHSNPKNTSESEFSCSSFDPIPLGVTLNDGLCGCRMVESTAGARNTDCTLS